MSDRDKLIELTQQACIAAAGECDKHLSCEECPTFEYAKDGKCKIALIADHLLVKGVTVGKDVDVPTKWIPVGERLPKELPESHPAWSDEVRPSNDVLVKRKGIRCLVVAWYSFSYEIWMDANELFEFDDAECWQELPEPPKGE